VCVCVWINEAEGCPACVWLCAWKEKDAQRVCTWKREGCPAYVGGGGSMKGWLGGAADAAAGRGTGRRIGGLQIGAAPPPPPPPSRKGSGAAKRGGVQRAPKGLVDHRHRRRRGRACMPAVCLCGSVPVCVVRPLKDRLQKAQIVGFFWLLFACVTSRASQCSLLLCVVSVRFFTEPAGASAL
jgi:hypothetical protein